MRRFIRLSGIASLLLGAMLLLPSPAGAASHSPSTLSRGPAHLIGRQLGHAINNDTVTSTNWGGYAVQSASQFTDVKGTWVEPSVTCPSHSSQYAAFWIGIDGYSSDSVEQIGTDSDCNGKNKPSYYAWYEMYPAASVSLSTSQYPVKPGDTLSAEVSVSGSQFTLSISSSEGWSFSTTQTGSGLAQSSAEWIAESPELCRAHRCSLAQLADYGSVGFTSAEAAAGGTDQPISAFTADGGPHEIICETSSGFVREQPSALGSGGDNFTITWEHD